MEVRREAGVRFVEQQQLRAVHQREREVELLLRLAGEVFHAVVGDRADAMRGMAHAMVVACGRSDIRIVRGPSHGGLRVVRQNTDHHPRGYPMAAREQR